MAYTFRQIEKISFRSVLYLIICLNILFSSQSFIVYLVAFSKYIFSTTILFVRGLFCDAEVSETIGKNCQVVRASALKEVGSAI